MAWLLWLLYTAGIYAGNLYIYLGSAFSPKLAKIKEGRKETLYKLKQIGRSKPVIWMHCASLGEFEQGRPLMEKLRNEYPDKHFILSFFSSSGYEQVAHKNVADTVIYLPADLPAIANTMLDVVTPEAWIFVKYEFWWNLISTLHKRNVPVILISAVFRPGDYFFKSVFISFKKLLSKYRYLFVQDQISADTLFSNGFSNVVIAGDTRIDRVLQRASAVEASKDLEHFISGRKCVVYGSIWMSDLTAVRRNIASFPDFAHIIAPHDISKSNIRTITEHLEHPVCLYSAGQFEGNVLIIDNIGMLASTYVLANYAYIGGGFEKGIHNILEPAVYGIPVFFGPRHHKFNEALRLRQLGSATEIRVADDLARAIGRIDNDSLTIEHIKNSSQQFFDESRGATEKIAVKIRELLTEAKNPK